MVLLESVWGFNGMFTDYRGTLLLSKQLWPSLCRPEVTQEWSSVTRMWRVVSQSLANFCSRESSASYRKWVLIHCLDLIFNITIDVRYIGYFNGFLIFHSTRADLLARASCLVVSMRMRLSLRAHPYSFRLPLHHYSGSSYLFTTYVASWLAMVLLESVCGFNSMFTFYPGTLLLSKQLGPSLCRPLGDQEWPSFTICHRQPGRGIQQALDGWERFRQKDLVDGYFIVR